MSSKIKVSFIVPFYGVEAYIEDCIKSLINQNMQDIEIILVDDCSPDNSLKIAEKYAKLDNRIKIIRHEVNKRQGGARNTGLANAQGEYIWFIDGDDYIVNDPNILNNLYSQAIDDKADLIILDLYKGIKGKQIYNSSLLNSSNLILNKYCFNNSESIANFLISNRFVIAAWRAFYKRDFLQKNNFVYPENTTSEDYVNPLWLTKSSVITYIPEAYYLYRKRSNSTTTSKIKKNQYKDNITMILAVADNCNINNWGNVYLGAKLLLDLFLYQYPLLKEFNNTEEQHKQQIVKDMAEVLAKISYIFKSPYFDEALVFGNINIPKKYTKKDLIELVDALKNTDNQENLKAILYKSYTKLNKNSKIKQFFKNIQRKIFP